MFLPPPLLRILLLTHTHTANVFCTTFQLYKQQTGATQSDHSVFCPKEPIVPSRATRILQFKEFTNKPMTSRACLSKLLVRSVPRGRTTYYSISNCCCEVSGYAVTHTNETEAAAICDQQLLSCTMCLSIKKVLTTECAYGIVSAIITLHSNSNLMNTRQGTLCVTVTLIILKYYSQAFQG